MELVWVLLPLLSADYSIAMLLTLLTLIRLNRSTQGKRVRHRSKLAKGRAFMNVDNLAAWSPRLIDCLELKIGQVLRGKGGVRLLRIDAPAGA